AAPVAALRVLVGSPTDSEDVTPALTKSAGASCAKGTRCYRPLRRAEHQERRANGLRTNGRSAQAAAANCRFEPLTVQNGSEPQDPFAGGARGTGLALSVVRPLRTL